jgi:hypothetical protein
MNSGQDEAAATELYNVQLAVTAYMADSTNNPTHAVPADVAALDSFIIGGTDSLEFNGEKGYGAYVIDQTDGAVSRAGEAT